MSLTELIKVFTKLDKKDYKRYLLPLIIFTLGGLLNLLNAKIFGGMDLMQALQEGLILGASAGGIYSLGKGAIDKEDNYE